VLTTHYLEEAESLCDRIAMLKQGRVVALDATVNLLKGFSGVRIRLRLSPDALPDAIAHLHLADEGATRVLQVHDYGDVEVVLATLRESGVRVLELEVLQADLEEVFVQVMRKP
jgi:ABC-2 type transport system ATP-binding protein